MAEYLIKVVLCQVILFLFYHFFLAKEKIHQFNRFYLIFSLLFSVIIPLIKIPAYFPAALDFSPLILTEESQVGQPSIADQTPSFSFSKWVTLLYISAFLFFTFRMIRNLFRINLIAMSDKKIVCKGYEIILTESEILPYSFLKRIFINRKEYESGKISDELLMHEVYHIQQQHSIDLIIAEIIQVLFWFNPILILHKRAIRLNHEYLADNAVIENQIELCDYQKILVEAVSANNLLPITSGFSTSWTKKRLLMMTKDKSVFSSAFKIVLAVPIIFLITVSFIFSGETNESKSKKELSEIFTNYQNFYGTWQGNGKFANSSLNNEVGEIPFQIIVKNDNTIEGTAGNATLYDISIEKAGYGIEICAMLSQPVTENEKLDKDHIVILWGLPEIEENRVDADFHLQKNFFLDPFLNAGGVIFKKSDNNLPADKIENTEILDIHK